jgi:hypothetical protein
VFAIETSGADDAIPRSFSFQEVVNLSFRDRLIGERAIKPLTRLLLAIALLLWSGPKLYAIFGESVDRLGVRKITIATDCREPFIVEAGVGVSGEGDGSVNLQIEPERIDDLGIKCKQLRVDVPGAIQIVEIVRDDPTDADIPYRLGVVDPRTSADIFSYSNLGQGTVFFDLTAIRTSLIGTRRRPPNYLRVHVSARVPHFLFSNSYSAKLLNLAIEHQPGWITHTLTAEEKDQPFPPNTPAPWAISAHVLMDTVYGLPSDASQYSPVVQQNGVVLTAPTTTGDAAFRLKLENSENSKRRDVMNVFAGAMLATGIAILADFLVDLIDLSLATSPSSELHRHGPGVGPSSKVRERLARRKLLSRKVAHPSPYRRRKERR